MIYIQLGNVKKGIHYLKLAAEQRIVAAQFNLGVLYLTGTHVSLDINKAIDYLTKAANANDSESRYFLGIIYYSGYLIPTDIKKSIYFILLSSKNGNRSANFAEGVLHHEGRYVKQDIEKAILFYKEASSFNNCHAKNNLGIIYKLGFGDKIPANSANAIVFFEEAIRHSNDNVAMYNMANILIYDTKNDINKPIQLLIKSMNHFKHSFVLLCMFLVKIFGFNLEAIKEETMKMNASSDLQSKICQNIVKMKLNDIFVFNELYESYRKKVFLYGIGNEGIEYSVFSNSDKKNDLKNSKLRDISSEFYIGFGFDM